MSPKFKGKEEDWLDDTKSRKNLKYKDEQMAKKKPEVQAVDLDLSLANATVCEVFHKQAAVILDEDRRKILCNYRRAKIFDHGDTRGRAPLCVGDRVQVQVLGSKDGVVDGRCIRRNILSRRAPEKSLAIYHSIASNLDALVIVSSVYEPDFTPGIVDRFLLAAQVQGIPVILCVNKIDILKEKNQPWNMYADFGLSQVFEVSAKQSIGLEAIRKVILGKTVVFCGHSGVGKTSLLNNLIGHNIGKTNIVNENTKKGMHTTSSAKLIHVGDHGAWIDTPGVREFGLYGLDSQDVFKYFPDLSHEDNLGCDHMDETDCPAKSKVRYTSYVKIVESIIEGAL